MNCGALLEAIDLHTNQETELVGKEEASVLSLENPPHFCFYSGIGTPELVQN